MANDRIESQFFYLPQDAFATKSHRNNDDTEIVVVSDTVRQRRARTSLSAPSTGSTGSTGSTPTGMASIASDRSSDPIKVTETASNGELNRRNSSKAVLPDLLPRTFHLAESSSLFSQIYEDTDTFGVEQNIRPEPRQNDQSFSVVAIRESNLTELKKPTYRDDHERLSAAAAALLNPKVGEINTVSILEIVDYFEPEFVETVNIIDVTSEASDTDTCTTPNLEETRSRTSRIADDNEGQVLIPDSDKAQPSETAESAESPKVIKIEKKRISHAEKAHRKLAEDRDILRDSENGERQHSKSKAAKSKKKTIVPSLKEVLSATGRDSFYSSDNENFDEPLVFSDDDDDSIPTQSSGHLSTDCDSNHSNHSNSDTDTVFMNKKNEKVELKFIYYV